MKTIQPLSDRKTPIIKLNEIFDLFYPNAPKTASKKLFFENIMSPKLLKQHPTHPDSKGVWVTPSCRSNFMAAKMSSSRPYYAREYRAMVANAIYREHHQIHAIYKNTANTVAEYMQSGRLHITTLQNFITQFITGCLPRESPFYVFIQRLDNMEKQLAWIIICGFVDMLAEQIIELDLSAPEYMIKQPCIAELCRYVEVAFYYKLSPKLQFDYYLFYRLVGELYNLVYRVEYKPVYQVTDTIIKVSYYSIETAIKRARYSIDHNLKGAKEPEKEKSAIFIVADNSMKLAADLLVENGYLSNDVDETHLYTTDIGKTAFDNVRKSYPKEFIINTQEEPENKTVWQTRTE